MERTARCVWVEGLQFEAHSHNGKTIRLDGWKDHELEEAGPTPGELLPIALGTCTGMDVVFIARKQRMELEGLEVEVIGTATDEHPKYFTSFEVIFHLRGTDLDPVKLERAIALSRDKYCIVGNSFPSDMPIRHCYTVNGGEVREVPEGGNE
jgi:putative redox protein